jgi:hemolysin III
MQGKLKEPFSAISHMAGAGFSLVGLIVLMVLAHGKLVPTASLAVYGCSLILLYSLSAVYHALRVTPAVEKRLQRLDHIAIFLLIAGTYTPICLLTLQGSRGWALLSAVWALAAAGITLIVCRKNHPHWLRVTVYVLMGWLACTVLPVLYTHLGTTGLMWLVAGGLSYTGGIYFYAMEERRPRWFPLLNGHEIWHLFVLAGSACHFVLIVFFVARNSFR